MPGVRLLGPLLSGIAVFVAAGLVPTAIGVLGPVEWLGAALALALPLAALVPAGLVAARFRAGARPGAVALSGAAAGFVGALLTALVDGALAFLLSDQPSERVPAPGLVAGWLAALFLLASPLAALTGALGALAARALLIRCRG